jgi:LmbE family N-acetylglucosaminyl deacetylase
VLAAHTDDEFGCAGLILRLIESGVRVRYIALSGCEESVPAHLPSDVLASECRTCLSCLGLAEEDVEIRSFRVRYFPRDRQDVLEALVRENKEYAPDLVVLPCSDDTHQDHAVVAQEGFRAFKHSTILGYELPQNLTSYTHSAFIELTPDHLQRKIDALASYKSQSFRPYAAESFIRGLAQVRGVQCRSHYAEAFELVRLIVRS